MATRRSRRTRDNIIEESLFDNVQDYYNFENRLIDLACGRFKFEGLPKEIYEPYVIRSLILENEVLFFYDDVKEEFICYPYIYDKAHLDIYGRPTKRRVQFINGTTYKGLTAENSVIIKGSNSGNPILPIIKQYARKLYIISRTIDVNVNAQKTPVIVTCDSDEKLSYENLLRDYIGNVPFLWGADELDLSKIKAINLGTQPVFNQLYELQSNLWNEFLLFLGVFSVTEKNERMNIKEVNSLLGGVLTARNNYVYSISRGLEEVNEKFGLNIKLSFGEPIATEGETTEESEDVINNE